MINQTVSQKEEIRNTGERKIWKERNKFSLGNTEFEAPTAEDKSNWHEAIKVSPFWERRWAACD